MKIGDTVAVIDEPLVGTISAIHHDQITLIDAEGFAHRYPKHLLVPHQDVYDQAPIIPKAEPQPTRSKKTKKHLVLDLHFDQLVEHPQDYDSFERLLIQREKLEDTLEFCRTHRIKKLEIIHGIGDGVLQKMVYEVLRNKTDIEFDDGGFFYHQQGSVWVEWR